MLIVVAIVQIESIILRGGKSYFMTKDAGVEEDFLRI